MSRAPADTLPAPVRLTDAVLGPMSPSPDPARLACAADTGGFKLVHLRADTPAGLADALDVHPPGPPDEIVEGPAIWGGPWLDHFGHMAAEGIHRLWAAHLPALTEAAIVFQARPGETLRPWFAAMLAALGIAPDRVRLVDRPTRFAALHVPAQGRTLRSETLLAGYDAIFPLAPLPPARLGGRLYVSRSRHIHTGSYLGETLVERLLAEAGFAIVHPQETPLPDLVAALKTAEAVAFAEGSAIHNLELCGRVSARLFVIGRRPGAKRRFGPLLSSLAEGWRVFPSGERTVSLDWPPGHPAPRLDRACAFIDLAGLVDALADFVAAPLRRPSPVEMEAAMRDDLLRYLLDPAAGITSDEAGLGRALRLLRGQPDVAALLAGLRP